jgi:hypothetical protein
MLQMFHLDVSKVDLSVAHVANGYTRMFQSHVSSVSSVFICMLQKFYLDVLKVDRVLHMLQWLRWLADNGLPQGFTSYLAPPSPSPLLSLPSISGCTSSSTQEHAESWMSGRCGTGLANEHADSRTSGRHSNKRGQTSRRSRHCSLCTRQAGAGVQTWARVRVLAIMWA